MTAITFGETMDNFDALTKEFEKHKGGLVLDSTGQETVMLIGFHDDKDDYYWEFLHWDGEAIKSSCVCSFVPLKEYLPKKIYQNLCDVFYINVIEPRIEYYTKLEEMLGKTIGRKPTSPIWG